MERACVRDDIKVEKINELISNKVGLEEQIQDLHNRNNELLEMVTGLKGFIVSDDFNFNVDINDADFYLKLNGTVYHTEICDVKELRENEWMILEDELSANQVIQMMDEVAKLESSSGMATVRFFLAVNEDFDRIQVYSREV